MKYGMIGYGVGAVVALLVATEARAGVEACGGMRLESAARCELVISASCEGQCDLDVYKKACATELRTVCDSDCQAAPEAECSTDCSEICEADCSNGVSLICVHNCFDECVGSCSAACADADDPSQCRASCEATCNGSCDEQCAIVEPDDSCLKHCLECCDGSCRAIANMDCQITCQTEEFESCEVGLAAECDGGCQADGTLFCDGEFVMSGTAAQGCIDALVSRGVEVDVQLDVDVDADVGFCSVGPGAGGAGWLSVFTLFGVIGLRRRAQLG